MGLYDINNSPGGFLEPQSVTDTKHHHGKCSRQPWSLQLSKKAERGHWLGPYSSAKVNLSVVAFPWFLDPNIRKLEMCHEVVFQVLSVHSQWSCSETHLSCTIHTPADPSHPVTPPPPVFVSRHPFPSSSPPDHSPKTLDRCQPYSAYRLTKASLISHSRFHYNVWTN